MRGLKPPSRRAAFNQSEFEAQVRRVASGIFAGITGAGALGELAFWTSASTVSGDTGLFWDNTNKRLGIGTALPADPLHVAGVIHSSVGGFKFPDATTQTTAAVNPLTGKGFVSSGGARQVMTWTDTNNVHDEAGPRGSGVGTFEFFSSTTNSTIHAAIGDSASTDTGGNNGIGNNYTFRIADRRTGGLNAPGSTTPNTVCTVERNGGAVSLNGLGYPYMNIGSAETSNSVFGIGFGYIFGGGRPAAEIAYQRTNATQNGAGDLVFGTRSTTNATDLPLERMRITAAGGLVYPSTDSSGTPGAATINKPTGRSAIAAAATSVTITNNLVTAASQVRITKRQFDATLTDFIAVCAAGSFTVTGNAAATAAWAFDWQVLN